MVVLHGSLQGSLQGSLLQRTLVVGCTLVLSASLAVACSTAGSASDTAAQPLGACDGPTTEESNANKKVMDDLAPSCAGCHVSGNKVFFTSLKAFESALVYNPAYVVAGKPNESRLIALMEGTAKKPGYTQMPTDGLPYAGLAGADPKLMPMSEIRAWVTALATRSASVAPDVSKSLMTRLSANQLRMSLQTQLGLTDMDLYATAMSNEAIPRLNVKHPEFFPFLGNDHLPAQQSDNAESYSTRNNKSGGLHEALGGATIIYQVREDRSISTSFATALTQVSQAWCRLAVQKAGNAALFPGGAMPTEVAAPGTQTKAVFARWVLSFLGRRAEPGELDRMFDTLYLPLAASEGAQTGFTGTCAYLVRHPDNVFY
jgi:hypothetical protein